MSEPRFRIPDLDDLDDPLPQADVLAASDDPDDQLRALLIVWEDFWAAEHGDPEWLIEPIIPAKRSVAIFAPGGTGKSLLTLWMVACVATGRNPFTGGTCTPRSVLYLDYEMTVDDLAERLNEMGFDSSCDMSNLHYALLPSLGGLDEPEGGKNVVRLAQLVDAELVVIDTFGRAVHGDENEADTVRAWYRWTGLHLKHEGRAFIRVDHAGKDLDKGQRGSSAKNDDVDVVWRMAKLAPVGDHDAYRLSVTKKRMSWVPDQVKLLKHDGPLRFSLLDGITYPEGTAAVAAQLDDFGIDPHGTTRMSQDAFRARGGKGGNDAIDAAQKYRRNRTATNHFASDRVFSTVWSKGDFTGSTHSEIDLGADVAHEPEVSGNPTDATWSNTRSSLEQSAGPDSEHRRSYKERCSVDPGSEQF